MSTNLTDISGIGKKTAEKLRSSGIDIDGWRLILAVGLAIYTIPSRADIRGALGRQDVQREA